MKLLTKVVLAIPFIPAVGGWFSNRRNGTSKFCALADIQHNAEDHILPMLNRAPKGHGPVTVIRDSNGKIIGSMDELP